MVSFRGVGYARRTRCSARTLTFRSFRAAGTSARGRFPALSLPWSDFRATAGVAAWAISSRGSQREFAGRDAPELDPKLNLAYRWGFHSVTGWTLHDAPAVGVVNDEVPSHELSSRAERWPSASEGRALRAFYFIYPYGG